MNLLKKFKSKAFMERDVHGEKIDIETLKEALGDDVTTSKIERFLTSRCNLSRSAAKAMINHIQADYFKIASK